MQDLLLDFVTFFTNRNIVAGDGVDAFRDAFPDKPQNAICIYEYQGTYVTDNKSDYLAGRSLQFVARDKSATAAKAKAYRLYDELKTLPEKAIITPTRWCIMIIGQAPFKIKVDDNKLVYYGFNVSVTTKTD